MTIKLLQDITTEARPCPPEAPEAIPPLSSLLEAPGPAQLLLSLNLKGILESIVGLLLSLVQFFAIPGTATHQVPLSSLSPGVSSNSCPLSLWWLPDVGEANGWRSKEFKSERGKDLDHQGTTARNILDSKSQVTLKKKKEWVLKLKKRPNGMRQREGWLVLFSVLRFPIDVDNQ